MFLDYKFNKLITPKIISLIYIVMLVILFIIVVVSIVSLFIHPTIYNALLILVSLLSVLLLRISTELTMLAFKNTEYLRTIAENTKKD
ncbi:DUF4282 domain-containing protein [Salmonella enterica]|nr:DUF4282 domain-containing protein [Salmonella enterica subsp. enterica serovar Florida]